MASVPKAPEDRRTCISVLLAVDPGGEIDVCCDMFDPNRNAHAVYDPVCGNLAESWRNDYANIERFARVAGAGK